MKRFAVLFLVLAACGGTTKATVPPRAPAPAVTTTTTAAPDFGSTYLRLVAPVNRAVSAFAAGAQALSATANVPESLTAPLDSSLTKFDQAVLRVNWPPAVTADVHVLVQDDATLVADLGRVNDQTALSAATFENQLTGDMAKLGAQASIVRADLGLPPPKA